jgi:hypothetical protein
MRGMELRRFDRLHKVVSWACRRGVDPTPLFRSTRSKAFNMSIRPFPAGYPQTAAQLKQAAPPTTMNQLQSRCDSDLRPQT